MSLCNLVFITVIAVHGVSSPANGLKKDWTYKLLQINWNTTNPDLFRTPLRTIRVGPGVYGIDGSIIVGVDTGDEYSVEATFSRSASGSSQYTRTPFNIPPTRLTKGMNNYYKNFFMKTLKNCSNLPQFEGEWEPPMKKGEYQMNSCVISTDNMPTHLRPGVYRILITFTGPSLVTVIEALAQVDATLM